MKVEFFDVESRMCRLPYELNLADASGGSNILQFVGLPIVNNSECSKVYRPYNLPIDRQCICSGYPEGIKDSCQVKTSTS